MATTEKEQKLLEKKKQLKKSGLNLFQKKTLRTILGQIGHIGVHMGCSMMSVKINLIFIDTNGTLKLEISNIENANRFDATHTAEEMRGTNPLAESLLAQVAEIVNSLTEFWNTELEQICFQSWLIESTNDLVIQIEHLKDGEIMKLSE